MLTVQYYLEVELDFTGLELDFTGQGLDAEKYGPEKLRIRTFFETRRKIYPSAFMVGFLTFFPPILTC